MNKQLVFVAIAAIFAMPVTSVFAATTTTGSVSIAGTCGIGSLSPLNYGTLTPSQLSTVQTLTVTNTGTVPGELFVSGTDWQDGLLASQIAVGNTSFGNFTQGSPVTPLSLSYQSIANNFSVGSNPTYWQVAAILINPTFVGSLTQTYTFTASC